MDVPRAGRGGQKEQQVRGQNGQRLWIGRTELIYIHYLQQVREVVSKRARIASIALDVDPRR